MLIRQWRIGMANGNFVEARACAAQIDAVDLNRT